MAHFLIQPVYFNHNIRQYLVSDAKSVTTKAIAVRAMNDFRLDDK